MWGRLCDIIAYHIQLICLFGSWVILATSFILVNNKLKITFRLFSFLCLCADSIYIKFKTRLAFVSADGSSVARWDHIGSTRNETHFEVSTSKQ